MPASNVRLFLSLFMAAMIILAFVVHGFWAAVWTTLAMALGLYSEDIIAGYKKYKENRTFP